MRLSVAITERVRYSGSRGRIRAASPSPDFQRRILFIHELLFTSEPRFTVPRHGSSRTIELIRGSCVSVRLSVHQWGIPHFIVYCMHQRIMLGCVKCFFRFTSKVFTFILIYWITQEHGNRYFYYIIFYYISIILIDIPIGRNESYVI